MWDLRLNNSCNHRIINEKLDIKGEYPNYYAILKRPVYGNNLKVKILDNNNLYSLKPKFIDYVLGEDRKTLVFNINIESEDYQVDVRKEVYPANTYYATYTTDNYHCPKCISGTNKTNDFYIDVLGRPNITTGLNLLIQEVKKILITQLESNLFDLGYGTELPNLIGKNITALTLLRAQTSIQNAVDYIQRQQLQNYSILSDDEKLLKMDNFQVLPTDNPKILKFSFEIYNVAGNNVNIGVSI